jgi:hypothetical protein
VSAFDGYVQAAFHGGVMAGGPTFTVVHDAETPLKVGYCDAIVEFFRKGPSAQTSAHAMVDPAKAVKMLPDNVVAYAAGPKANTRGWHLEQSGYARFTRADWTTPDGLSQLRRVGACFREIHDTWGIPKRWMTDDQLRRAAAGDRNSGGMTTHQQVARVLGGTTHTDPEDNYPRDLLLQAVLDDQEDDMFSDQDRALLQTVAGRLRGPESRPYDMLQSIESTVGRIDTTLIGSHTDGTDRLTDLWVAILGKQPEQTDAAAIAAMIPDGIAEKVADALAKRLAA